MRLRKGMVRLVFGGLIGGLIALIAISEYYSLGYTSSIEAVGAILFSGLLVWLYHRQSEILDNQEGLMEQQNRMLMEGHRPQLEFELSGFEPSDDLVSFEVENVGPGTAYDIGFELILEPRKEGYKNLVSYGRVVSEEGNEPASLGVLPSSEKRQMNFQIRLPNPNKDTEQHSLPVSEALSKFDYSHFARPTIFVKTVYSDASGKSCGGTIIEQLAFATEEPLQDVEDLWSYGVNFLGVEDEAWRDLE